MKLLLALLLSGMSLVQAQDLESLLGGSNSSPVVSEYSYLADAVRTLVPKLNSDQVLVVRNIEQLQWVDALVNWKAAFDNSSFANSESGLALYSLLLYKSGLEITGLEELFRVQEPKKIQFQILRAWKNSAPVAQSSWSVASISWKQDWTEIFDSQIEVKVKSQEIGSIKNIEALIALSKSAPVDTAEKAQVDWNLSLQLALQDQADKAARILSGLMKAKNNPINSDLMNLSAARMLYQNAYYDAAQKYDDKISKDSELYFEAQEEKAWSYLRRGESQNALATTQTLVNPAFKGLVGPESWFVRALAQLKICDYTGVLETLRGFPGQFRERTIALELLGEKSSQELELILENMKTSKLNSSQIAKISKHLPRDLARDQKLKILLTKQVAYEKESQSAEAIFAKTLALTGLQGEFDRMKSQIAQKAAAAKSEAMARGKELAKFEVEDTKKIINKMHIVEAEVLQQVSIAPKLASQLKGPPLIKNGTTGSNSSDAIRFPLEKELWFDEVSNYRVDLKKGCQARRTE